MLCHVNFSFSFSFEATEFLTFDMKGVIGSFSVATSCCIRASRIIKFVALVSYVEKDESRVLSLETIGNYFGTHHTKLHYVADNTGYYLVNQQALAPSFQSFYDIRGLRGRATSVLGTKPARVSTKRQVVYKWTDVNLLYASS